MALTDMLLDEVKRKRNFNKWFEGSHVVDESSQPQVFYHGTRSPFNFDSFSTNPNQQLGAHFTADPAVASDFADGFGVLKHENDKEHGRVLPVHLSIKNPYDMLTDLGDWSDMDNLREYLGEAADGPFSDELVDAWKEPKDAVNALKGIGHDGITYQNTFEQNDQHWDSPKNKTYIAFDPEQIKSIHNRGTYDPKSPDILSSHPAVGVGLLGMLGLDQMADKAKGLDLRKSGNDFLDTRYDPAHLEKLTGEAPPTRYGDIVKEGLGQAPGLGDVLSLADAYKAASEGNWGEAALDSVGLLPFMGSLKVKRGFDSTSRLGNIGEARAPVPITEPQEGLQIGQRISTTAPTPVQAEKMGFHNTSDHTINSDMMRENPEAFAHNMDLISEYMPTRKRTPEGIFKDSKDWLQGNLEYFHDQAPQGYIKRSGNWYKGANAVANDMSEAYDIPIEAAGGVLARLSPSMDWNMNVDQGDRLADIWRNHQNSRIPSRHWNDGVNPTLEKMPELIGTKLKDMPDDEARAAWIRAFNDQTTPNHYQLVTPEGALSELVRTQKGDPASMMWQSNGNLAKAVGMLRDPSPENISRLLGLGGHKIRNFYNNIVDPFHPFDTTIDTHAVSGAMGIPYSQSGIPVGHAFGGGAIPGVVAGSAKSGGANGTYGLFADAYRDAAQNKGLLSQALQSPIWEIVRETFPRSGAGKAKLQGEIETKIMAPLKKGLITPDQAREQIIDAATGGRGLILPSWYRE